MRKQFQQISILALAVVFLAGCGAAVNPQEQLATKIMASMDDVANIFSTIKDEKSAEAAKVRLEALSSTMNSLTEQAKKLGDPSPELKAKLEAQMEAKAKVMQDKMMEFAKVAMTNPKILEIIGPVMQKMGSPK